MKPKTLFPKRLGASIVTLFLFVAALQFLPPEFVYRHFVLKQANAQSASISQLTGYTGQIGQEDINWGNGLATSTFQVPTSDPSVTVTLTAVPSIFANIASIVKGKWYVAAQTGDQTNASVQGTIAWVAAQLSGVNADLELPSFTYTFGSNYTIPANIHLVPQYGAILSYGTTNLNIAGPLDPVKWPIFSGTGTLTLNPACLDYVRPEWWTANTTPGTTDMTSAIRSADVAGVASGLPVFYSPGTRLLSSGITLSALPQAGRYQIFTVSTANAPAFANNAIPAMSPEWFGAAGNGTTDDTIPIQTTVQCILNSAALNNGSNFIPFHLSAKTYLMTQPFPIGAVTSGLGTPDMVGMIVEGEGKDSSVILNSTSPTAVCSWSLHPEVLENTVCRAVIRNLRIKTGYVNSGQTQIGLNLNGMRETTVQNVAIENFYKGLNFERATVGGSPTLGTPGTANQTAQCYYHVIDNVYIYEAMIGIWFQVESSTPFYSGNANRFSNIHINGDRMHWGSAAGPGWTGIQLMGSGNFFNNVHIGGGYPQYGVFIGTSADTSVSDNAFFGLYLESLSSTASSYGIYTQNISSRSNYFFGVKYDSAPTGSNSSCTGFNTPAVGCTGAGTGITGYVYDQYGQLTLLGTNVFNRVATPDATAMNAGLQITGSYAEGGGSTQDYYLTSGSGKTDSDGKTVPVGSFAIKNISSFWSPGAGTMPFEIKYNALDNAFAITSTGILSNGSVQITEIAIGSLPTCNSATTGTTQAVNNSNCSSYAAAVGTTTGSVHALAYCDGTSWKCH
jgi:hypothetical protein